MLSLALQELSRWRLYNFFLLYLSNQVTCHKAGYTQKMFCGAENFLSGTWSDLSLKTLGDIALNVFI